MLTIGELAAAAGTTVRAVRHYHAVGLLPEPERDHSGYRRYGATALLRLLRVRRLRELGLDLGRIATLLAAEADDRPDLQTALDELDAELAAQADRIAAQRARLAQVRAANPDPELPVPLAQAFAAAAASGMSARTLRQEREVVLLDLALHPERAEEIVEEYTAVYARALGRPGYQELADRLDALADLPPDAPEIEEAAQAFMAVMREEIRSVDSGIAGRTSPVTDRMFRDWVGTLPATHRALMDRIGELIESAPLQQ